MNLAEQVLEKNQTKWLTLPAGECRHNVQDLLCLSDTDLKKAYSAFRPFWDRERGWEHDRYGAVFKDRHVLEIGSGLGYDGIMLSRNAATWTFCDIIEDNLSLVKRMSRLYDRQNVRFEKIGDISDHVFPTTYDGFYAHGVLHHLPFDLAKKEVANINRYLEPGTRVVVLMYPIERWEMAGRPDFNRFGRLTDGEGTPWAEYYDDAKIGALFGPGYTLLETIKWGHQNSEFVNFELEKQQKG
jgi:SAM-dependent methyltransferase